SIEANTLVENLEPDTNVREKETNSDRTNVKKKRRKNEAASSASNNNDTTSSLTRRNSFEEAYCQQSSSSTTINTSSQIGPFKTDLDVCLYLVQHPQLNDLALNIINAALQMWAFGCYRDYNASLRRELRKLVPKFIRKHNLLDKEVVDAVKNLNYMTVDLEIFMADNKNELQKLDLRSLL
ncbi:569_t:CDS:2, partial [Racocetra fulgida]